MLITTTGSVGNTIGPRNAPNPATPAFPTPEAQARPPQCPKYPRSDPLLTVMPEPGYTRFPRWLVRIVQDAHFFLFSCRRVLS